MCLPPQYEDIMSNKPNSYVSKRISLIEEATAELNDMLKECDKEGNYIFSSDYNNAFARKLEFVIKQCNFLLYLRKK